jgi:hypothetical protein
MNQVTGKILLHETGVGIPNLVVTVYDVDSNALPQEAIQSKQASPVNFWERLQGDRLGSVLTDADGTFLLEYDDREFKEERPDLLVFVTAPEGPGLDGCSPMLHVACGIRQNAGRIESYLIRLTAEELSKAGVPLPSVPAQSSKGIHEPADVIGSMRLRYARQDEFRELARQLAADRIGKQRETDAKIAKTFGRIDKLLSPIPESIRESHQYVPMDADIQQASLSSLSKQVEMLHRDDAPVKMTGRTFATNDQINALKQADGSFKPSYKADEFDAVRFGATLEPAKRPPTVLVRVETAFDYCQRTSLEVERCLGDAGVEDHPDDDRCPVEGTVENPAVGEGSALDIPRYVAGLLETPVQNGAMPLPLESRPTQCKVQKQVNDLELRGGPADAPAYYDFHHLQIAFDHVWTEAFDQSIVERLKELYRGILELGGEPPADDHSVPGPESSWFSQGLRPLFYSWQNEAERACLAVTEDVPASVALSIGITKLEWNALPEDQRDLLKSLAESIHALELSLARPEQDPHLARTHLHFAREGAQRLIDYARRELSSRGSTFCKLNDLLADLCERLKEEYAFKIYAAKPDQRSVNFGLLVTYRQKWVPLNYQAGELAATIPLAPKEVRRFTKRQVIKKSRAEKEIRNNLQSHREDATETSRAEAEIINKANSKTAFQLGTQTGANVGFDTGVVNGSFNGSLNAGFSKESASISEEVKREFREAVFKAAQEYKEERTLEVRTEAAEESEITESGEISNPNDELTVTYLFYELQRRYRVSEQIHRVTPVVFVAQEVPSPHEIDDAWIVAHDWILRRVLLDDSFRPALTYLATQVRGDEYALEELRKNMEMQRKLLDELKEELVAIRERLQDRYAALEKALAKRATAIELEDEEEGFFEKVHEFHFGELEEKPSPEAARVREDAARDAYERAAREEKELRSRLDREVTALQTITEQYTKQLSEHLNRRAQIDRLRLHIKQNILYYMQSIWSYEPPDQRFFRLHRTPVPKLDGELEFINVTMHPQTPDSGPIEYEARCKLNSNGEVVSLAEMADLDQLLGYKGNYMIFPLKQSNCLTDFMMVPYVDSELGLRDPDELGNWTLESFAEYVCCLKKRLSPNAFNDPKLKERLRRQYLKLLQSPRRDYEEIIVPTGELFIEALPGAHPLLEDFKLRHRAMDVEKVRAEVQRQQLENLRLAARLLAGELEDPEIEKKIVIHGQNAVIVPDGGSS